MVSSLFAQRPVTGIVTSQIDGETIPGVNVFVKGTYNGVTTDFNGVYTINVPDDSTVLVYSFVGMKSKEVLVGNRSVIDVSLLSDISQLQEIVVTAMGIEKEVQSLGYSVSQITSSDFTKVRTRDIMSSLQGKVAGVSISTASGLPGSSTKVIMRGYSSFRDVNNPLYIVDGVPIDNASNFAVGLFRTLDFGNRASDINPDDIESISLLKGTSAGVLYGSRAANGVIMITTKKGEFNAKPSIEISSSIGFTNPLRIPTFQNRYGQGEGGVFTSTANGSWGPRLDGVDRLHGNIVNNEQLVKSFTARNSLKDFYKTGVFYNNTFSMSGGNDVATYYLTYGNINEDGIIPSNSDTHKRNTISLRGSMKTGKLKASGSINYIRKDITTLATGQGGDGETLFQQLLQVPRDYSIVDFEDYQSDFNNLNNFYSPFSLNPYWIVNEDANVFTEDRIHGFGNIVFHPKENIEFSYRIGVDASNTNITESVALAVAQNSPNAGVSRDINGMVADQSAQARQIDHSFMVNADLQITDNIGLSGLLGVNMNERSGFNRQIVSTNLAVPGYDNILAGTSNEINANERLRRLVGVYGQLEFSYKEYLFLTVQARNDWSSTLPKNNNSFFYPAFNASFNLTEVTGTSNILSAGRVRASWGRTGNDAPVYSVNSVMNLGGVDLLRGNIQFPFRIIDISQLITGFEVGNILGNQQLQPEVTTEIEFGTDLELFKSRVGIDFAYYIRESVDQILPVPVSPSSGYTFQNKNLGVIENQGFEILLTGNIISNEDFHWSMNLNFTQNRNKIISLNDELDEYVQMEVSGIEMVAIPGKPFGVLRSAAPATDELGRIIVDSDGIPIADPIKKIEYGDINPDFILGGGTSIRYKNFALSAAAEYRRGGVMYSNTQRVAQNLGNTIETQFNDRRPFIVPNSVKPGATEGTFVENDIPIDISQIPNYWNSDINPTVGVNNIVDRSYFKLRQLTLDYNLPQKVIEKLPVQNVQVGLFGRNLLLITPNSNRVIDPESTTFGNDLRSEFGEYSVAPTVRSYGLRLYAIF